MKMFLSLFNSAPALVGVSPSPVPVGIEERAGTPLKENGHADLDRQEVMQILAQHRRWLKSGGEAGDRAHLAGTDLRGTDLHAVDLRAAFLRKADLAGADLSLADLRGAYLIQANLQKANLLSARLQNTALQGATLDAVTGLLPGQLAGANLSGATLPQPIAEAQSQQMKAADGASQKARRLFLAMLLASLCCAVIVSATTDVQLLKNSAILAIPGLANALPTDGFFLLAPLFLLCLYMTFHLYLQRLWEQLAELPAVFPDGQPLDRKGRWLLMGLARNQFKWLDEDRLPSSPLESAVLILPTYWVVPATLVLFWGRYLTRQDLRGTIYHVCLIVAALVLAAFLPRQIATEFRPENTLPPAAESPGQRTRPFWQVAVVTALGILLSLVSFGTIYGDAEPRRGPAPSAMDVRAWAARGFAMIGYNPYASLAESDISRKPANWTGKDEDLPRVGGARLNRFCLRHAEASHIFLANARLWDADFENADLTEADLRGADLHRAEMVSTILDRVRASRANLQGATLHRASLLRADLREADLSYAFFSEAILVDAQLTGSILYGANLRAASLVGAHLDKADLRESNLEGANLSQASLREAYLWSAKLSGARLRDAQLQNAILIEADLRKAILRGADLQGAVLRGALLEGADLEGADLRGAVGLTADQLCSALGGRKALLDPDLQLQLEKQCPAP